MLVEVPCGVVFLAAGGVAFRATAAWGAAAGAPGFLAAGREAVEWAAGAAGLAVDFGAELVVGLCAAP